MILSKFFSLVAASSVLFTTSLQIFVSQYLMYSANCCNARLTKVDEGCGWMGTTQPVSMEIRDESRVVVNSVIESVWYSLFYLKQDYLLQRLIFY